MTGFEITEYVATILTPLVLAGSAIAAWLYHRKISIKRSTVDFVLRAELGNSELRAATKEFGGLHRSGSLESIAHSTKQEDRQKAVIVSAFLNHFEFVAIAIKEKAMDESIYKQWNRTTYVNTWARAEPYIRARRIANNQHTMYIEFERLARKWLDS